MKNYFFKNKTWGHSYTILSDSKETASYSLIEYLKQYYGKYFSYDKSLAVVSLVHSNDLVTTSIEVNEEHFTTLSFTLKEYDVNEVIDTDSE